jgi:hypothetical protein
VLLGPPALRGDVAAHYLADTMQRHMGPDSGPSIEAVRGRLDDAIEQELLAFWAAHAELHAAEARRRLPEVLCVLRAGDGTIAGVCSAFATDLALIANRRVWMYRSLLPGDSRKSFFDMFAAAYEALDSAYDGADGEPVGLCVPLEEREQQLRPEAEWQNPRTIHAGHLPDGRRARIAYFTAARSVSHDPPSASAYRVVPFAEQDAVGPDDVISLWTAEAGLPETEARRRIDEVMLVAIDDGGTLAGVTTRYLKRNEQLRMDLWYVRAFTAAAHRQSMVATALAVRGREYLEDAFVSGRDTRAGGLIYEVENELLKRVFPKPIWKPADVLFIGENEQGAHVRVHYFAGALAP